jgi:hypothetical protein
MSQQHTKTEKRNRRKRYLKRLRERVRVAKSRQK